MAANPKTQFTVEEYYALEAASERRWEFWDGEITCMSGGTREHGGISSNTHYRLRQALEGGSCTAFTADTAVFTPTHPTYFYPDVSVACEPEFRGHQMVRLDMLINAVLIVEVLSETSRRDDFGRKFEAYKAIPTFSEYLLIEQKERCVTHWQKIADEWICSTITDGLVRLASVDCELEMADIYDGVEV